MRKLVPVENNTVRDISLYAVAGTTPLELTTFTAGARYRVPTVHSLHAFPAMIIEAHVERAEAGMASMKLIAHWTLEEARHGSVESRSGTASQRSPMCWHGRGAYIPSSSYMALQFARGP